MLSLTSVRDSSTRAEGMRGEEESCAGDRIIFLCDDDEEEEMSGK